MSFKLVRCVRKIGPSGRSMHAVGLTVQQTTFAGGWTCLSRRVDVQPNPKLLCRYFSTRQEQIMNVFDRNTKRIQRNQAASLNGYEVYDYIKDEMGWRMADRINDISRTFQVVVDVGCGRGHIAKHILKDNVGVLYQCDMAEKVLEQSAVSPEVPTVKVHCDEEFFPFKPNSIDLVVSSMSLHWVNDLPGVFKQIQGSLKADGCFMGAMFGGETLFELRVALQLAEEEVEGGLAAHVSPFTSVQDLGNLLNRAGYSMLTIGAHITVQISQRGTGYFPFLIFQDVDELVINYPSMRHVMKDIQGMGENNCAWSRKLRLNRATLKRAEEIYKEMYGKSMEGEDCVPATFHILNFIGWKPDVSQAQPAKRGSGQVSIKDIDKLDQLAKQIEDMKSQTTGSDGLDKSMGHLTEQLDKLKASALKEKEEQDDDKR